MSDTRGSRPVFAGTVLRKEVLSGHLLRLVLGGAGLADFASTGVLDEWVALTVPGQFQTRYYTVRSWSGAELVVDVVVHDVGLVTGWAQQDCLGETVGISVPKGSFGPPLGARWLVLVGDLTALPAIARITESTALPVTAYVESPDGPLESCLPVSPTGQVVWLEPPAPGGSGLAALVRSMDWPPGEGYFWMAGESAQMREIRRHVRHEIGMESDQYDVMGYWSTSRGRLARPAARVEAG